MKSLEIFPVLCFVCSLPAVLCMILEIHVFTIAQLQKLRFFVWLEKNLDKPVDNSSMILNDVVGMCCFRMQSADTRRQPAVEPRPPGRNGTGAHPRRSGPNNNREGCYRCGKKGHIRSDCPGVNGRSVQKVSNHLSFTCKCRLLCIVVCISARAFCIWPAFSRMSWG